MNVSLTIRKYVPQIARADKEAINYLDIGPAPFSIIEKYMNIYIQKST